MEDTRTIRQQQGAIKAIGIDGTLLYPPGFGKTNVGIMVIQEYRRVNPSIKIGVLTPSMVIQNQWKEALLAANIADVKLRTIDSLISNYDGRRYRTELLIVDEIHKFFTDVAYTFISGERIIYTHILGLTGTKPINDLTRFNKLAPVLDTISIKEAIANGWISNYIEFNYGLDFTSTNKDLYVQLSKPITDTLQLFKGVHTHIGIPAIKSPVELIRCCTNGYIHKWFDNVDNIWKTARVDSSNMCNLVARTMGWSVDMDITTERGKEINYNWAPSAIKERCQNFNNVVKRRNDLINNNKTKLNAVLEIVTKFANKKGIIFNQSTEFADNITNCINIKQPKHAVCYHTNIESRYMTDEYGRTITTLAGVPKKFGKTTLKRLALDGLRNNTHKILVTVMALDTGFDVEDINLAIITSGTINPMQDLQRKGRSFRLNPDDKDEVVLIFNLYMKDFEYNGNDVVSRDRIKLETRQRLSEVASINIDNLDEVEYLYKN